MTATDAGPLTASELDLIDAWWRAANYLSVGQIYLLDNPLLTEELKPEHVKPRLLGQRGGPATDLGTLCELLLRVSRLADDLPEVTELDLSPVIARPHGVFATDARIKLAPCLPQDPFLRRLR